MGDIDQTFDKLKVVSGQLRESLEICIRVVSGVCFGRRVAGEVCNLNSRAGLPQI